MANLSNINNKFLVTTGGNVLIGQTSVVGSSILQVTGDITTSGKVNAGDRILTEATTSNSLLQVRYNAFNYLEAYYDTLNVVGGDFLIKRAGDTKIRLTAIGTTFTNLSNTSAASSSVDEIKIGTFGAGRPAIFLGSSNTTYTNSTWFIENIGASGKFRIGRNGLDIMEISNAGTTTFKGEILNAMAAPKITLKPTTQNNASILELGVLNGGTNAYARIDAINLQNFDTNLRFWTNAPGSTTQVERMRITSDGNVAIAMTPINALDSTLQVCEIGQTVVSGGDIGGKAATFAGTGGASNSSIVTIASTNTSIGAQQGGEIGFAGKFMTGSNQFAQFAKIMSYKADTVSGNYGGGLQFWTRANATPSAVKMTIDPTGNVGVGITSPATKLNVANAGEVIVRSSMTAADGYRGGFEADNQHTGGTIWSMFSTNNSDGYFGGGKFVIANESMGGVDANTTAKFVINGSGNVGIGTASPIQKLDVQGNVNINGTVVEEGSGNNKTFRYRTPNSNSHSGGNALITFGRFYWTPAHWVNIGPVLEVTLQCKYYSGYQRKYIIKAGYGDNEVIVNELQPSETLQRITLQVGTKTAAGYNYAGQPVYYVDLQWTQTAYIWGWAQLSQQVPFLTANPTSGWGGVVVYSALSQNNNAGTPTNHPSFFAGNIKVPSTYSLTTGTAANMHVDSNGFFYRSTSSLKYKTDVRDYDKGLNEVMQLQPKYYKGKDDGNVQFAGLIAEDVHDLGLTEFVQYADDETPDALAYPNMIALLTKAIQELKAEIELLKSK